MNKRKAIKILKRQIWKLNQLDNPRDVDVDFLIQTKTYIDKFFGNESAQSKRLTGVQIAPFLNDCVDTINNIGLYKHENKNILSKQSNWKLVVIAITIFVTGLTTGIWIKENTSFVVFTSVNNGSDNHTDSKSPK